MVNGIINVYKEKGYTSFDVVAKLRGIFHQKKIGHTGTLDPDAQGVLPVCLGKATRVCDLLTDKDKVYKAVLLLGQETDTQDISGQILNQAKVNVTDQAVYDAISQFIGRQKQVPPMYSALKVNGKKLYELARAGKEIEREPRAVHIDSIDIIEYDEASRRGVMKVDCEKGTYIRSVISDIGEKLGCGGMMTSLERSYSGGVDIKDCYTIEEIAEICEQDKLPQMLIPLDRAFESYEKTTLGQWETKLYRNGVKLRPEQTGIKDLSEDKLYRVYGSDNSFLGIGAFHEGSFRSFKNF